MNNSPAGPIFHSPGPRAFEELDARQEPWLAQCYVPPAGFSEMAGSRSVIVFGKPGEGKTALYQMLQQSCLNAQGSPTRLAVPWKLTSMPAGITPDPAGSRLVSAQIAEACGFALARLLAGFPVFYTSAPAWAQAVAAWYLRLSIPGVLSIRLGPVLAEATPQGRALLDQIIGGETVVILYDPTPEQMMEQLVQALPYLGLNTIWILMDGLESLVELAEETLKDNLNTLLATLSLFEHIGLVYKLILPAHLAPTLSQTASVRRRRVDPYQLAWSELQLRQMVEARLALVLKRPDMRLDDLCAPAAGLNNWLARVGGASPREWLDQVQPLVRHYCDQGLSAPLDLPTWQELRAAHPPRFWMDETGHAAQVGGREIPLEGVPPKAFDMLRYLYHHSSSIVGKDELYYLVYLGRDSVPRTAADHDYVPPKDYTGLIDTSLYRLRKAIEPDPDWPVLIQTVRGYGVRLVRRW